MFFDCTNPFLGIDLIWADVEEDDSGAIIGLKRDRMARKQHRLLSVTQNSIVDGDDASNDNDLSNARKSDGSIQQVPNNQINTTQNSISTSPASIKNTDNGNRENASSSISQANMASMGFLNETCASFLFPRPPSVDIICDGKCILHVPSK